MGLQQLHWLLGNRGVPKESHETCRGPFLVAWYLQQSSHFGFFDSLAMAKKNGPLVKCTNLLTSAGLSVFFVCHTHFKSWDVHPAPRSEAARCAPVGCCAAAPAAGGSCGYASASSRAGGGRGRTDGQRPIWGCILVGFCGGICIKMIEKSNAVDQGVERCIVASFTF